QDTTPTRLYPLSLHDALPISTCDDFAAMTHECFEHFLEAEQFRLSFLQCDHVDAEHRFHRSVFEQIVQDHVGDFAALEQFVQTRSEEHTSELQSRFDLVCRLL